MKYFFTFLIVFTIPVWGTHEFICNSDKYDIYVSFGVGTEEYISYIKIKNLEDSTEFEFYRNSSNIDTIQLNYKQHDLLVVYKSDNDSLNNFKIIVNDSISIFETNENQYPISCHW